VCLTEVREIEAAYPELVRLHGRRFDQLGKASCFLDPSLQAFQAGLLRRMSQRKWPRLYLLQVDGRTVAALYGFSVRDRFSYYQSGMDPDWADVSVGLVSLGCSIRAALETGHTEFDFLRGTPSYKLHWAKFSRKAITARLFDYRPRSLTVYLLLHARERAARLKRVLRKCWERVLLPVPGSNSPADATSAKEQGVRDVDNPKMGTHVPETNGNTAYAANRPDQT
jgi:CelD/BcsL family acetyltransferase involved in cellulose biosynthesis